ncbi:MAG: hypothetical protein HFH75_14755 [Lachnospiraceae bacterium]|nr:hypothetical protein [Lachnospiraceae bacterium]
MRIMTANIMEKHSQMQCERYTIDTDRLVQRLQQKKADQPSAAEKGSRDTVDISEDARKALEALKNREHIEIAGAVEPDRFCMEQKVFEEYEQAVMAEQREKVTSGNFDRHVDKMVSAYQKMKKDIEEKYADADEDKKQQLELLDKAYESHSKLMAKHTETMYDLTDFTPQITYHSNKHATEQQVQPKPDKLSLSGKYEKGAIRDHAYNAFMTAIGKGGTASQGRADLNRIWDHYAALR